MTSGPANPVVPYGVPDPARCPPGINLVDYLICSPHASDEEMAAAQAAGVKIMSYGAARQLGVSHDDTLAAAAAGVGLLEYGQCRQVGDDHEEAVAGLRLLGREYCSCRQEGKSRDAVLLAARIGVPSWESVLAMNTLADLAAAGVCESVLGLVWVFFDRGRHPGPPDRQLRLLAATLAPLASSPVALSAAVALADGWSGSAGELVDACLDSALEGRAGEPVVVSRVEVRELAESERFGLVFVTPGAEPQRRLLCCTWRGCQRDATHEVWVRRTGRRRPQRRLLCDDHTTREVGGAEP